VHTIAHERVDPVGTDLDSAFLQGLVDYQRLLPDDLTERSDVRGPLRLEYKGIMIQREIEGQAENFQKPSLRPKCSDSDNIEDDPDLATLAMYLDKTAPSAAVDPAFRERLRDELLDILPKRPASETTEIASIDVTEITDEQHIAEIANRDQEPILPRDPDSGNIENDPDLATLATYLDKTAPSAAVDPAFRETLRDRLLGILAERPAPETAEMPPDNVTEIAEKVCRDLFPSSLAPEIADFPDRERTALLIDLANCAAPLKTKPTQLEQAFLEVGIRLQDYKPLLPQDLTGHEMHIFFLDRAYRRVVKIQESSAMTLMISGPYCSIL